MSVIGRLWRRAPAWRVSLVSAIALTGLAAMFPPSLPTMHWPWSSPWRSAARSGPDQASFHPAPDQAPSDLGESHFMPPGIARTGFIAEAGRQVPLPDGSWQELGVAVAPGTLQRAIFTRVVGNHLTGLFQVAATGALGGVASPVGVPPECSDPSRLAGAIVPAQPGQSPLAHECWQVVPLDMHAMAAGSNDVMLSPALSLLGKLNVAVPAKMLAVTFFRSTDSAWQATTLMVPDSGNTVTALRDWAGRYLALLHKSFDGTATQADLTRSATHDPS